MGIRAIQTPSAQHETLSMVLCGLIILIPYSQLYLSLLPTGCCHFLLAHYVCVPVFPRLASDT